MSIVLLNSFGRQYEAIARRSHIPAETTDAVLLWLAALSAGSRVIKCRAGGAARAGTVPWFIDRKIGDLQFVGWRFEDPIIQANRFV
jgi:hypothetical protein